MIEISGDLNLIFHGHAVDEETILRLRGCFVGASSFKFSPPKINPQSRCLSSFRTLVLSLSLSLCAFVFPNNCVCWGFNFAQVKCVDDISNCVAFNPSWLICFASMRLCLELHCLILITFGVKIVLYSTRLRPKGINKLGIRTDQYSYFFKSVLYSEVALYWVW